MKNLSGLPKKVYALLGGFLILLVLNIGALAWSIRQAELEGKVIHLLSVQSRMVHAYVKSFFYFMETQDAGFVQKVVKEFELNQKLLLDGFQVAVDGLEEEAVAKIQLYSDLKGLSETDDRNRVAEINKSWEQLKNSAVSLMGISGDQKKKGFRKILEDSEGLSSKIDEKTDDFELRVRKGFKLVRLMQFSFLAISLLTVAVIFLYFRRVFLKQVTSTFSGVEDFSTNLGGQSRNILSSTESVAGLAQDLSAAVDETVSAVTELTRTMQKNSDFAQRSVGQMDHCRGLSETGKVALSRLNSSMNDIKAVNEEMSNQVNRNREDLRRILELVVQVKEQTEAIHDIVFQTKLLSFNASVEAARAGEHGKGFSVVAEEIGALARLSGDSAEKIFSLIDSSAEEINRIIETTKADAERITAQSAKTLEAGLEESQNCESSFDQVFGLIDESANMLKEINLSTDEQNRGISQIGDAMNDIQKSYAQTKKSIDEVNYSVREITDSSEGLEQDVLSLKDVLLGKEAA